MPIGHHRKPFSSKQKKEQLKAKRERKRNAAGDSSSSDESEREAGGQHHHNYHLESKEQPGGSKRISTKAINHQPVAGAKTSDRRSYDPNRFNLHFLKESAENLKRLRKEASKALRPQNDVDLEVSIDDIYRPSSVLDMPIRPSWSYEMSKEQLDEQEKKYFNNYLEQIFEVYKENQLSYFELNLETWRQLWRVLEISDIILLIVDIRFPALHFSPKFYEHCTQALQKDVILILNKIDLVPTSLVVAWKHYFETRYPNLHIILFSSAKQIKYRQKQRQQKGKKDEQIDPQLEELEIKAAAAEIQTARAHRQLYECVKKIVSNTQVDLSSWDSLTQRNLDRITTITSTSAASSTAQNEATTKPTTTAHAVSSSSELNLTQEETQQMNELFYSNVKRNKFEHGFVTIGCCGFPNVGKSSLLNSLNGRKVVSVSRTPGHTKHLQTIFLTKSVRLCDCPGLVFPSLVCKPLQVLAGIYPIAQLQEPYSAIRYMAERIPMIDILGIKHPTEPGAPNRGEEEKEPEWSPLDICDAWAVKRGYLTAKASRPDTYRAANELLRMSLDGKLCVSLRPRGYSDELSSKWECHEETLRLKETIASVEAIAKEHKSRVNAEQRRNQNDPAASGQLSDSFDEQAESDDDGDDGDAASDNYYRNYYHDFESTDEKDRTETNDTDADVIGNKFNVLATSDDL